MDTIGARIRYARSLVGLPQTALAKSLRVSREAVSQWESDKNAPTADKIGSLAVLLRVLAEWIFAGGPVDPKSGRPIFLSQDELSAYVANLKGKKKRARILEMLKLLEWGEAEEAG